MSRIAPHTLLLLVLLAAAPLLAPPGPSRSAPAPAASPKNLTNSIKMQLVRIPAGKFKMGSPKEEAGHLADEGPRHEVEITRPFYLGVYEVTQAQYKKVMGTNPSAFCAGGTSQAQVRGLNTDDFPAENMSWSEAADFCKKLSALPAEKAAGRKYRLPTEAEWEYACRAGTTTAYSFGATLSTRQANVNSTLPRPQKVGSYKANAWGLYDMHGNVWELTAEWYDANYYGKSPKKDPHCNTPSRWRMARGGAWCMPTRACRCAYRGWTSLTGSYHIGFRVACNLGGSR
jgi:formylglycine-generating enzyme required for sulfatase activity